jgi:hypothetical protein
MLDSDMRVVAAEFSGTAVAVHNDMERNRTLDHPFKLHGHSILLPAKRWSGAGYVPLKTSLAHVITASTSQLP